MSELDPPEPNATPSSSWRSSQVPPWVIKAIVFFWAGYVAIYIGTGAVRSLRTLIMVIVISLFVSFAIEPSVNRLEQRGIRRGIGVWIMFGALFVAAAGFSIAVGAALASQLDSFVEAAPGYVDDIERWLQDNVDETIDLENLSNQFIEGGDASNLVGDLADDVLNIGATVVNIIFQSFTVLLFTYYMVAEGPQLRRTVCSFLEPERQRMVLEVWDLAIEKTGGYIVSRSILAAISSVVHWIAFELIGVPFPLALALWVGVLSQFIPVVGTYIAGALPVLIALLDDPPSGIAVLAAVVVYQQIENYVFAPRVTAQTMEIHVAVAFGAVMAGAALLGVIGALLALPFAATAQAFVNGYRQHHEIAEEHLTISASRRGRRT